jgi:hypothetical protein
VGDAGYLAYLDYNGDGTVNNSDAFQLKRRFLTARGSDRSGSGCQPYPGQRPGRVGGGGGGRRRRQ